MVWQWWGVRCLFAMQETTACRCSGGRDGAFVRQWGGTGPGEGPGQFKFPSGVEVIVSDFSTTGCIAGLRAGRDIHIFVRQWAVRELGPGSSTSQRVWRWWEMRLLFAIKEITACRCSSEFQHSILQYTVIHCTWQYSIRLNLHGKAYFARLEKLHFNKLLSYNTVQ